VIHSHSPAVLPFTITGIVTAPSAKRAVSHAHPGVDLRPCVHMAGFLGMFCPRPTTIDFDT
jgi:hypothetical protein